MTSDRPRQTLADYVALLISPALIVGLVGSLVFFLLEVLYSEDGEYKGRLQWWILFPFVCGAVLAARVSLTAGIAGRAGVYGLILAVLTWIGMQAFVEYPKDSLASSFNWLINGVLVLVVWWCAHRLTHDCTNIDEETEVPGEGVLQAAGLEKADASPESPPPDPAPEEGKKRRSPGPLVEWWERFQRWREGRKNRRVLGVWVIYFSLAAFPLYGLGEALIPVTETDRRQYAFWLMFVYVGCGLGLLLTTCFLGLRRYLRQRKLQMPAAMTGLWLSGGAGLILALLVVGALLPRPRAEYAWIPYQPIGGGDKRDASPYGPKGGDSGKGPGNEAGKPQPAKPGEPADKDAKGGAQDKDKDKDGPAKEKDKDSASKDKQSGEKSQDKESPAPKDKGEHPDKANEPQDKSSPDKQQKPPQDKGNQGKNDQPKQDPQSPQNRPTSSFNWTESLQTVATVLKWVVFALIALAVLFFIFRSGLRFLANFTTWARRLLDALNNFWANLFAGWGKKKTLTAADDAEEARQAAAARPFASFGNPFDDGRANRLSPAELVQYTFAALQAWAREHRQERQPGETPLEFAARLGDEFPALEADVKRLAALFARAVYDFTPLPANTVEVVRRFWQRLETAAKQPLSM